MYLSTFNGVQNTHQCSVFKNQYIFHCCNVFPSSYCLQTILKLISLILKCWNFFLLKLYVLNLSYVTIGVFYICSLQLSDFWFCSVPCSVHCSAHTCSLWPMISHNAFKRHIPKFWIHVWMHFCSQWIKYFNGWKLIWSLSEHHLTVPICKKGVIGHQFLDFSF